STATFLHSLQSGPREGPVEPSPRAMPDQPPLRRTASLPDRLNGSFAKSQLLLAQPLPHLMPSKALEGASDEQGGKRHLSRPASITLLIVSTGLVAACA